MSLELIQADEAIRRVRAGGVIAYPTEAVYGLGCDPASEAAVSALLALKKRRVEQGLIVIGAAFEQFAGLVEPLTEQQLQPALESWPGPNTWLLPAAADCPTWVRGRHSTVAVRVSAHPVCRKLCELFGGPLISTSANPYDEAPAVMLSELEHYFPEGLAGVVEGELGSHDRPTSIRDLLTGAVIRSS